MVCIIYHVKYNLVSRIYQALFLPCHPLLIFVRGEGGRVSQTEAYIYNESVRPTSLQKKKSPL